MADGLAKGTVDVVVKIGGSVLASAAVFHAVLAEVSAASHSHRLLVVPGGGPFADVVRELDRRLQCSDSEAHWMAVLAMDQHAQLIGARLEAATVVDSAKGIDQACSAGKVPVLAPFRWLRAVDPLPHSWDVTSDSISAWVSGQVGAGRLVLVKPPGSSGRDLLDAYFSRALPPGVSPLIVSADRLIELRSALLVG